MPESLERIVSSERFAPFVTACDGDRERAVALYEWTGKVAGAFWTEFRVLEIAYRNRIDQAITAHVNANYPHVAGHWFDDDSWHRHHSWNPAAKKALTQARSRARGQTPPRGAIVCELTFGFWRYMISPRYEQTFWVAALDDAFTLSAATAAARRNELEQHLIDLHKFRNRLAHHEPIFKPQTRRIGHTTRSVTLADQLSNILSVLDAIDPHISSQRQADTAVTELLQSRP